MIWEGITPITLASDDSALIRKELESIDSIYIVVPFGAGRLTRG